MSVREYTTNLTPGGSVTLTICTVHGQIQPEFFLFAGDYEVTEGWLYERVVDELGNGIDAFDFRSQIEGSEPVDGSGFDECAEDDSRRGVSL